MEESHSLNWLEASEEKSVARRIAKKLQVKSWEKSNYRSSEARKSVCKFTQISGWLLNYTWRWEILGGDLKKQQLEMK